MGDSGQSVWLKRVWVRRARSPFGDEHYTSFSIYYTEEEVILRKLQGDK